MDGPSPSIFFRKSLALVVVIVALGIVLGGCRNGGTDTGNPSGSPDVPVDDPADNPPGDTTDDDAPTDDTDDPTDDFGGGGGNTVEEPDCNSNSQCGSTEVCDAGECRTARCDLNDFECTGEASVCDAATGRCVTPGGCPAIDFFADENESKIPFFQSELNLTGPGADPTVKFAGIQLVSTANTEGVFAAASVIGTFSVTSTTQGGQTIFKPLIYKLEDGERVLIDTTVVECNFTAPAGDPKHCDFDPESFSPSDTNYTGRKFYRYDLPVTGTPFESHAFLAEMTSQKNLFWPVYRCGNFAPVVEVPEEVKLAAAAVTQCEIEPLTSAPYFKVDMAVQNAASAQIEVTYGTGTPPEVAPLTIGVGGGLDALATGSRFVPMRAGEMKITCKAEGAGSAESKSYTVSFETGDAYQDNIKWNPPLAIGAGCDPESLKHGATQADAPTADDGIDHACHAQLQWQFSQKVRVAEVVASGTGASHEFTTPWTGKIQVVPYKKTENESPAGGCGAPVYTLNLRDITNGGIKSDPSLLGKPQFCASGVSATPQLTNNCIEIPEGTEILRGTHGRNRRHDTCNRYKVTVAQFGSETSAKDADYRVLDLRYHSEFKIFPSGATRNSFRECRKPDRDTRYYIPWKGQHLKAAPKIEIRFMAMTDNNIFPRYYENTTGQMIYGWITCENDGGCVCRPSEEWGGGITCGKNEHIYFPKWVKVHDAPSWKFWEDDEWDIVPEALKTNKKPNVTPYGYEGGQYTKFGDDELGWPDGFQQLVDGRDFPYFKIETRFRRIFYRVSAEGVDGQVYNLDFDKNLDGAWFCGGRTFPGHFMVKDQDYGLKGTSVLDYVSDNNVPAAPCALPVPKILEGTQAGNTLSNPFGLECTGIPGYYCKESENLCKPRIF